MPGSLFERVVVPVANQEDARSTAASLQPYLDASVSDVLAVHVIEKAGGAPDKASVEQRELDADGIFAVLAERFADSPLVIETEIRYGTNIAAAIIEAAHEADATAIVFTPRGAGTWVKVLTEDVTTGLIDRSDIPIVMLPDVAEE